MGADTAISWCQATWSPWEGCTKVSPGCDHCYAAGMNQWLRKGENWGPGAPRRQYSDEHWKKPLRWNAQAARDGRRLTVFPSVCDPFDNEVDPAWRVRFFDLIAQTPNLTWLLLSKRVGNASAMVKEAWRHDTAWPRNVWLGATVVNQEEADRDIPKLLAVPARVRFLSVEPMLGPVNLQRWLWECCGNMQLGNDHGLLGQEPDSCCGNPDPRDALHWAICGGESGHGARPLQVEWVRSIVKQCKAAGVPVHVKQLGKVVHTNGITRPGEHWPAGTAPWRQVVLDSGDIAFAITLKHPKGGDPAEWGEDLRVQEFPA